MSLKIIRLLAWCSIVGLTIVTLSPINLRPRIDGPVVLEHFFGLLIIGSLFAFAYSRKIVWAAVYVLVSILCLELLQLMQPERHARPGDAAVKMVGACIGVAIGWLGSQAASRKSANSRKTPDDLAGTDKLSVESAPREG